MKWISVKDKIPEYSERDGQYSKTVLITDGESIAMGCVEFFDSKPCDNPYEGFDYIWIDDNGWLNTHPGGSPIVTHWSLKPKPPK